MGGNFMLTDELDAPKRYCLDLEGYAYITDLNAPVIVHSCKEGFFKDGTWLVDYPQPGQIHIPWYELCVAAGSAEQDAEVFLQECSDAPLQHFAFREDGKVEVTSESEEKFCLAVAETSRPTGMITVARRLVWPFSRSAKHIKDLLQFPRSSKRRSILHQRPSRS